MSFLKICLCSLCFCFNILLNAGEDIKNASDEKVYINSNELKIGDKEFLILHNNSVIKLANVFSDSQGIYITPASFIDNNWAPYGHPLTIDLCCYGYNCPCACTDN